MLLFMFFNIGNYAKGLELKVYNFPLFSLINYNVNIAQIMVLDFLQ